MGVVLVVRPAPDSFSRIIFCLTIAIERKKVNLMLPILFSIEKTFTDDLKVTEINMVKIHFFLINFQIEGSVSPD